MYSLLNNKDPFKRLPHFFRSILWLGSSQLIIRLLRLFSIVIVARLLNVEDYGIIAIALGIHEIFHSFSSTVVSSRLIQASEAEFKKLSDSAYSLSWVIFSILFFMQLMSGYISSQFYQQAELFTALSLLSVCYLLLPFSVIHCALLIRQGRHDIIAKSELYQAFAEVITCVALVLNGFGFWSLILPKLVVTPLWVLYIRQHALWQPPAKFDFTAARDLIRFGSPVALTDILVTVKIQLVFLTLGYSAGVESTGLFFFAYSAGLGISLSLIRAYNQTIYSTLSRLRENFIHSLSSSIESRQALQILFQQIKLAFTGFIVLIVAQVVLAPFYVPVIFGEAWVSRGAIPVIMLLCLSAPAMLLINIASQLQRVAGRVKTDLFAQGFHTILYGLIAVIGTNSSLMTLAIILLIMNVVFSIGYLFITLKLFHHQLAIDRTFANCNS